MYSDSELSFLSSLGAALRGDASATQREVACRMGVSMGLVNLMIARLSRAYHEQCGTDEAIKGQFVKVALNITATLVCGGGLDRDMMQAVFVHIISANLSSHPEDYDSQVRRRIVLLVLNYRDDDNGTDGGWCDGIGALNVECRLQIKNYKRKKDSRQEYSLDVAVRAAVYTDVGELLAEVHFLKSHRNGMMFFPRGIPCPQSVSIYDALPPASDDAFNHSLPLEQTEAVSFTVPGRSRAFLYQGYIRSRIWNTIRIRWSSRMAMRRCSRQI